MASQADKSPQELSDSEEHNIPVNTVNVTFLSLNGERHALDFPLASNIGQLKQTIFNDWPKSFPERPAKQTQIRLVYLGKFLEEQRTLSDCNMDKNKVTILLNIKLESIYKKELLKKDEAPGCKCIIL